MSCCKYFFDQMEANLAEIQPQNHQNVQNTHFWQKAPGVNGSKITGNCAFLNFSRVVWSVECGVRSAECGVRSAECGVWSVECGVWSVECGVWSVECGVWSVECGVLQLLPVLLVLCHSFKHWVDDCRVKSGPRD